MASDGFLRPPMHHRPLSISRGRFRRVNKITTSNRHCAEIPKEELSAAIGTSLYFVFDETKALRALAEVCFTHGALGCRFSTYECTANRTEERGQQVFLTQSGKSGRVGPGCIRSWPGRSVKENQAVHTTRWCQHSICSSSVGIRHLDCG